MNEFHYIGSELEIFEEARRWKAYWRARIAAFVAGDVLEVGAGIGANTTALSTLDYRSWLSLEPDSELAGHIALPSGGRHRVVTGTLADLPNGRKFDTILYLDVLEHIERDAAELASAAQRLNAGGALIVVAPAHSFLYTPFDRAIGHYRRYDKRILREVAPESLRLERLEYLDAAGMLASLANRWLLRSAAPSRSQILFWDRLLVPCSRVLDPLSGRRIGKSILAVWRKS